MNSSSTEDLKRLRTDHIGSLVRPAKLKEAFARYDRRRLSNEELRRSPGRGDSRSDRWSRSAWASGRDGRRVSATQFSGKLFRSGVGFRRGERYWCVLRATAVNQNPLERAEQNFDEKGPAIITRRPAVERLKLLRNIPLEEFRFAQSVAKKTSESDPYRPRPRGAALQVGSFHGRVQRPRRFCRAHRRDPTANDL